MKRHFGFGLALLLLTAALYWGAYFLPFGLGLTGLWSPVQVRNQEWLPQWSGISFHVVMRILYAVGAVWLARALLGLRPARPIRMGVWIAVVGLIYFFVINLELLVVVAPAAIANVVRESYASESPSVMRFYTRGGLARLLPLVVLSQAVLTYGIVLVAGRPKKTTSTAATAGLATTSGA